MAFLSLTFLWFLSFFLSLADLRHDYPRPDFRWHCLSPQVQDLARFRPDLDHHLLRPRLPLALGHLGHCLRESSTLLFLCLLFSLLSPPSDRPGRREFAPPSSSLAGSRRWARLTLLEALSSTSPAESPPWSVALFWEAGRPPMRKTSPTTSLS